MSSFVQKYPFASIKRASFEAQSAKRMADAPTYAQADFKTVHSGYAKLNSPIMRLIASIPAASGQIPTGASSVEK